MTKVGKQPSNNKENHQEYNKDKRSPGNQHNKEPSWQPLLNFTEAPWHWTLFIIIRRRRRTHARHPGNKKKTSPHYPENKESSGLVTQHHPGKTIKPQCNSRNTARDPTGHALLFYFIFLLREFLFSGICVQVWCRKLRGEFIRRSWVQNFQLEREWIQTRACKNR